MLSIDQYAYMNRLREYHPGEKLFFAVSTLALCLFLPRPHLHLTVIIVMAGILIIYAGVPWRIYLKLIILPTTFLILGVVAIALTITAGPETLLLYGTKFGGIKIGFTRTGLLLSMQVFLKSLAAVSCMYFLSLTTPLVELITVLGKMRVPKLVIELMGLVYRFIFVLLSAAQIIVISQSSRCGYSSLRASYRSFGNLATSLLLKSCQHYKMLTIALLSRCYSDELKVLDETRPVSIVNIISVITVETIFLIIGSWGGGGFPVRVYS